METMTTTQTVRPLTVEELPLCVEAAQAFHDEMGLDGTFAPEGFLKHWAFFLTSCPAVIFGLWKDDGLVGGFGAMLAPDINTSRLVANEFFWYVNQEHRGGTGALRLLKAFEAWGTEKEATVFRLVHLLGPEETTQEAKLSSLYTKLGYHPVELTWQKTKEAV